MSNNFDTSHRKNFSGVITPVITPLSADGKIDAEGLRRMVDHLVGGGVSGLFVLGTTGEGPSLEPALQRELIKLTCEYADGRLPVFVSIAHPSIAESISLSVFSKEKGASAVVAAPPYYFDLSQDELKAYFSRLADKTSLPLFLYNIPSQTKVAIELHSVSKLASHPNIIGIKDSSGNAVYHNALLHEARELRDFGVFVGPDEMLASTVLLGGNGGVNSGSNMFPELFVALYKAARHGRVEEVHKLQKIVMMVSALIYNGVPGKNSFLKGIKAVLYLSGIISDHKVTSPLLSYDDRAIATLKQNLATVQSELRKSGIASATI